LFVFLGKFQEKLKYTFSRGKVLSTCQLKVRARRKGKSMMLHVLHKRWSGMTMDWQPNTNQENIPPKLDPIRKPTRATRTPTMSVKGQWTNEAYEETMYVVECGNKTLKQTSRLWSILLSFLFNYLNGKTWTRKVGVGGILIVEKDVVIVTWIWLWCLNSLRNTKILSQCHYFYTHLHTSIWPCKNTKWMRLMESKIVMV
jgi:hypothetical protein